MTTNLTFVVAKLTPNKSVCVYYLILFKLGIVVFVLSGCILLS